MLGIAVASAVAYALARWIGIVVLLLLGAGALAYVAITRRGDDLTAILFVGSFALPMLLLAGYMGTVAGRWLHKGRFWLVPLPILPFVWLLWSTNLERNTRQAEARVAEQAVRQHPQVAALVGGPPEVWRVSATYTTRDPDHPRYEFGVGRGGRSAYYVIVQVDRTAKPIQARVRCVTATRFSQVETCAQTGVVPVQP